MQRSQSIFPLIVSGLLGGHSMPEIAPSIINTPPAFPTPGRNRKAAKRRAGIQHRHGKAARK